MQITQKELPARAMIGKMAQGFRHEALISHPSSVRVELVINAVDAGLNQAFLVVIFPHLWLVEIEAWDSFPLVYSVAFIETIECAN